MKRVLLDESLPEDLRHLLLPHDAETVGYRRWKGRRNGVLMGSAREAGFEVLLTADQGIPHQQNLDRYAMGVVVLFSNVSHRLEPWMPDIVKAIEEVGAGKAVYVDQYGHIRQHS